MRISSFSSGAALALLSALGSGAAAWAEQPAYDLPEIVVDTVGPQRGKAVTGARSTGGVPGSPEVAGAASSGETGPSGPAPAPVDGLTVGRTKSDRIVEQVTTVEEVTASQIERVGASTLDEALRLMPGISFLNGGDGVPRLNVRGFRTRNVTLLIDGVPQGATYDGQFDPRAVPVENIARIKVTRGGGSVLYGPGGNAAVVEIITKSAQPGLHGTTEASFGAGRDKEGRVTASYGAPTVQTFVSASIYQQETFHLSDDFKFTRLQPTDSRQNSDREDRSYYANTQWTGSEALKWGISVSHREGEYGKPPTTINSVNNNNLCPTLAANGPCSPFATGVRFERVDDYADTAVQSSGFVKLGSFTLRPTFYYNTHDELTNTFDNARYATKALTGSGSEDAAVQIYGAGTQLAYRFDDRNLVTLAFDAHREEWTSEGFTRRTRTGVNLATCTSLGGTFSAGNGGTCANIRTTIANDRAIDVASAGIEYESKLTQQLSAVAGAGWAEQQRDTTSDSDYTYLAGLRFALTDLTALRGSVARKIRFPTLRNLYGTNEGVPTLVTEVTQNYEAGIEQQLPAFDTFLSVTGFHIDAENFIEKNRATQFFENREKLRFQGIETTVSYRPNETFGLQIGYTYLRPENLAPVPGGTTKVQNDPEHTATVSATYRIFVGTALSGDYQFVTDSFSVSRDQLAARELDTYHLVNIGITQDLGGPNAQLFGRVENVLDDDYALAYGFPEPGRTFYLGFRSKL